MATKDSLAPRSSEAAGRFELDRLPAAFVNGLAGGRWNSHTCNVWDSVKTVTESQERKLDLLAAMMNTQPGLRVLDVSAGTGGGLCYIAERYGISGVGLTRSQEEASCANRRAISLGLPVKFVAANVLDYEDEGVFDGILGDEVKPYMPDPCRFYEKLKSLLQPEGVIVTKSVHVPTSVTGNPARERFLKYSAVLTAAFGSEPPFISLEADHRAQRSAGLAVLGVASLQPEYHAKSIGYWLDNLANQRDQLEGLVGPELYANVRTYYRILQTMATNEAISVDITATTIPLAELRSLGL